MQRELLIQAMMMFDKPEKWNAFVELSNSKNDIRSLWYQRLKIQVSEVTCKDAVNGWCFHSWNSWDFRWFLKEFGLESFCICMSGCKFGLWVNQNEYDTSKISELLSTDKYSIIMSTLRADHVFSNDWKLLEYGNFDFDVPCNGHLDDDQLAWFAGNETKRLAGQVMEKVDRIRRNKTISDLFVELNSLARK